MVICPSCASEAPDTARFCPTCGHLLATGEERRFVTVVFADLVGFTALSEEMDPEQVKRFVDRCFQRLVADITAFGGSVDKIVGDAIVALFGAPTAHEDDPERAVRASLRMQRSVADLSEDLGLSVELRVGINTGEVLVGAVRAGGDYTAMGDTVNAASRLEEAAEPGEILVGPETHAATSDVIRYESRGVVVVRGRQGAIEVYAAKEELTLPGRRVRASRAPMVGRDIEMGLATAAMDAAFTRRHAHLITLLGETGMGKNRLAEEVANYADRSCGALVLEARCLPYGETGPLWPLAECFRAAFHIEPGDGAAASAAKVGLAVAGALTDDPENVDRVTNGLLHLLGDPDALAGLNRERARDETQHCLQLFLRACARRQPVVLVLADSHWADRALLELMEQLLAALRTERFVVVTTARWTVDDDRWVATPGRHNTLVLNLLPLDERATAELAAALLGSDLSSDLASDLYARSGGNPFFLEELAALLSETEFDPADAILPEATRPSQLPDNLRGLIAARLDSLTPAERAMVDDAAVIGRDGPVYALIWLSDARAQGGPSGEQVFSSLVAKDFFETDGDGWRFRSDLVREVAYETLTKSVRMERHWTMGARLADQLSPASEDLRGVGRVAYHYQAAAKLANELGDRDLPESVPQDIVELAIDALRRVGRLAVQQDSPYVAGRAWFRILQIAPDSAREHRLEAHLGRGRAWLRLGEPERSLADAADAVALAKELGDPDSESRARALEAEVLAGQSDLDAAAIAADEAVRTSEAAALAGTRAEALRQRGFIHMRSRRNAEAETDLEEAAELYVELGDKGGEGWCLQNLAWLNFQTGAVTAAEEYLNRAIEVFESVGDVGGIEWSHGLMAYVRYYRGERDEAEALAAAAAAQAESRGDMWSLAMVTLLRAAISTWSGRTREAIVHAQDALDRFTTMDDAFGRTQALTVLARALTASGRYNDARQILEDVRRDAAAGAAGMQTDVAWTVSAVTALQAGDDELAYILQQELEGMEGVELLESERVVAASLLAMQRDGLPGDVLELEQLVSSGSSAAFTNPASALALGYVIAGRTEDAIQLAATVLADTGATYSDLRTARIATGLAHAREGRAVEAEACFAEAVAEIDQTEAAFSQAVVRMARASAAEVLGLDGAEASRAEADRALERLGTRATGWQRAFDAALQRIEPGRAVSASS